MPLVPFCTLSFDTRSLARPERPRGSDRTAVRSLRSFALSCLAAVVPALAPVATTFGTVSAQNLIQVTGEYGATATVTSLNPDAVGVSPVIAWTALPAIPVTTRIRGITPVGLDGICASTTDVVVYAERDDGTSQFWRIDHVAGTAVLEVAPLLWGSPSTSLRPVDMVGFARTPIAGSSLVASSAWHTAIGGNGALHAPILSGAGGSGSAAPSGSLPFPGPYLGGARYGQHLLIMSTPETKRLHMVAPLGTGSGVLPSTAPVEVQSWIVPVSGQVLGFTVSATGYYYAVVSRILAKDPNVGYIELVRSTQSLDVAVGSLTLVSVGTHISDWVLGEGGSPVFPPVQLTFANN